MKISRIITYTGTVVLVGLAVVMPITNPSKSAYEEYATARLAEYLKNEVCRKAPTGFQRLLQGNCTALVDSSQPQLQQIIARTTRRQNFIFFSIYRTDLFVNPFIPAYRFETVGILQNFYTYAAQKQ